MNDNNGCEYFRHSEDAEVQDAPFHYKRSGLDNIYLLNGFEERWEDGERFVSVLDTDGLHKAIGLHLVCTRKSLTPKEIRFLRKTLDLTQAALGRSIDQSSIQVARWEKGQSAISGPADRLLRLVFVYELFKGQEHELPLQFLNRIQELDAEPEEACVQFQRQGKDWRELVS